MLLRFDSSMIILSLVSLMTQQRLSETLNLALILQRHWKGRSSAEGCSASFGARRKSKVTAKLGAVVTFWREGTEDAFASLAIILGPGLTSLR